MNFTDETGMHHILGARAILQPLACGNAVIFKGSELSPKTFWTLASVFHEAGLPAGCLNTIYHAAGADAVEITQHLVSSPVIQKIKFTGSTAVGSVIASLAGKNLKPVVMELGGKASAIVCQDADAEKAATACAVGAFLYAGEICMSTERVLVHEGVYASFMTHFKRAVNDAFGNNHEPQHPISRQAIQRTKKLLVQDAVQKGASITLGDIGVFDTGAIRPIASTGVKAGMDLHRREPFGPLVSIIEVGSDEEAIRIANDTEYGLSSAISTENLRRGLSSGKRIESGAVHINRMTRA